MTIYPEQIECHLLTHSSNMFRPVHFITPKFVIPKYFWVSTFCKEIPLMATFQPRGWVRCTNYHKNCHTLHSPFQVALSRVSVFALQQCVHYYLIRLRLIHNYQHFRKHTKCTLRGRGKSKAYAFKHC